MDLEEIVIEEENPSSREYGKKTTMKDSMQDYIRIMGLMMQKYQMEEVMRQLEQIQND